jgi:tRNA nucleotidyltransferase (CCA-adding enzyme)
VKVLSNTAKNIFHHEEHEGHEEKQSLKFNALETSCSLCSSWQTKIYKMRYPLNSKPPCWEHFEHDADIGIRGIAPTLEQAFEQAAIAMTAVVTDPALVADSTAVAIECAAPDAELLFVSWINELVYEMAVHRLLFKRYQVVIDNGKLSAMAFGTAVDRQKHQPAVEIKGATFTELHVYQQSDQMWIAQCVIDV